MLRMDQVAGDFSNVRASKMRLVASGDALINKQDENSGQTIQVRDIEPTSTEGVLSTKQSLLCSVRNAAVDHSGENIKFRKLRSKVNRPTTPSCGRYSDSAIETQIMTTNSISSPKSPKTKIKDVVNFANTLISLLEVDLDLEKSGKKNKSYKFLTEGLLKEKTYDFSQLEKLGKDELSSVLISYATESKEASMSLQSFISECSMDVIDTVREILLQNTQYLIIHRFGSYVLQRLITRDASSLQFLSNLCQTSFTNFMKNEYSSRVMQLLIECSNTFRKAAIKQMELNFLVVLESGAASHLLKACIKNSNAPEELDFVLNYMENYPVLTSSKLFRNVLMAYMQRCSTSRLRKIAVLLRLEHRFLFYLNSKSFTSLLFLLLERGERTATDLFLNLLRNYPLRLFACRCLHMLLEWITNLESDSCSFAKEVGYYLAYLPNAVISRLHRNGLTQFYLYVVLSCLKDSDPTALSHFFAREIVSEQVARFAAPSKLSSLLGQLSSH
jgi:hypothetical protein